MNFNDRLLSSLVQRAVKGNRDLMIAEARLKESRALRDAASSGLFPTLSASASAGRRRGSSETGLGKTTDLYAAGFDARWEIDIFGAKRRAEEAAAADLQAAQEDLRDVMVSFTAEVAINYLEVRSGQRRLLIARENLAAQGQTLQIARWRRQAGLVTQRDEDLAMASFQQTRALIPALEASIDKAINRIAVLLGENPGALNREFEGDASLPVVSSGVAIGIPADLLRRRPDIRGAERRLAAATANIGVSTAALYPSLPLTGSLGLEALSTGNLFTAGARAWALTVAPVLTLFDGGRNRANVMAAEARQEQALAAYEKALLGALADVEDSMSAYAGELRRLEALSKAEEASRSAMKAAEDQYKAGLVDFLAVLEAQRTLLSIQDQRALSEAAVLTDLVRLYKSLGGGWHPCVEGEES
jgi:NodT family efflux transporter outer membrane factor (OMF) lipoprotein